MTDGNDNLTVEDADDALFGPSGQRGGEIVQINIDDIYFDLSQPRRSIPVAVRLTWTGSHHRVIEMIQHWCKLAEAECGEDINLWGLAAGIAEVGIGDGDKLPLTRSLVKLFALAVSIERRGQINAITVIRDHDDYIVETGERRLLAYHILCEYRSDKYNTIAATVVKKADVWRMAHENSARADLNAIELARQLGLLLMDLCGHDDGVSFGTFEEMTAFGDCDRAFYAQAADGDVHKLKKGQARLLADAIGKSVGQMRQYRALLRIPDDVWERADYFGWAEGTIREIVKDERHYVGLEDAWELAHIQDDQTIGEAPHDVAWDDLKEEARLRREAENLAKIADNEGLPSTPRVEDDAGADADGVTDVTRSPDIIIPASDVVAADSIEIMVGDRVVHSDFQGVMTVIDIFPDNQNTWVRYDDGTGISKTCNITKLRWVGRSSPIIAGDVYIVDDLDNSESRPISDNLGQFSDGDIVALPDGFEFEYKTAPANERYVWYTNVDGLARQAEISKLTLVSQKDGGFEIDRIHYDDDLDSITHTTDVYIPDTQEDARPAVNRHRPELGRLLTALSDYYDTCEDIQEDQIGWCLEDMLSSDGSIRHDIGKGEDILDEFDNDMRTAKKLVRSYLEQIADHVDQWADKLREIAASHHEDLWCGDDDNE